MGNGMAQNRGDAKHDDEVRGAPATTTTSMQGASSFATLEALLIEMYFDVFEMQSSKSFPVLIR